ncbi:MAG: c-type cytochrome [Dehalococcoidales bacterium]|nr:c-type cytochrome [Dehalococcoidales bacterium]
MDRPAARYALRLSLLCLLIVGLFGLTACPSQGGSVTADTPIAAQATEVTTTMTTTVGPGCNVVPGGDANAGRAAIEQYNCGNCHVIPGIPGATGTDGPSLMGFGNSPTIAGAVPNNPSNLIQWIMNPKSVKPNTTMPDLGVTETDARNIAAYLCQLHGGPTPTPLSQ